MCGRLSQIALGADIRISARDCRFSIMEAKWGLIPDMSATVTLRDLVPKDIALELVGVFMIPLGLIVNLIVGVAFFFPTLNFS
jgi:enoyl-CoA hydratase/carnithine racemase